MERQFASLQARLDGGDRLIGWKVGFGAPAAMERLEITAPLVGFLTAGASLANGAQLDLATFTKGLVEPEIAIYIGKDLGPGPSEAEARAAIAGLGPVIEIADITGSIDDIETILATDIFQRGLIVGDVDQGRAGADLDDLAASISVNGAAPTVADDLEANTGSLVGIVRLVADTVAAFGRRLEAGQFIIGGSVVPPFMAIDKPVAVEYRLGTYAPLSVTLSKG